MSALADFFYGKYEINTITKSMTNAVNIAKINAYKGRLLSSPKKFMCFILLSKEFVNRMHDFFKSTFN